MIFFLFYWTFVSGCVRTLTATDLYTARCHGMNDPVYKRMAAVIDHVFILLSLAHVCLTCRMIVQYIR